MQNKFGLIECKIGSEMKFYSLAVPYSGDQPLHFEVSIVQEAWIASMGNTLPTLSLY